MMQQSTSPVIPVVLSGGAGTRLWPLSRQAKAKQFFAFDGEHSLLQATLERCQGDGFSSHPIIISLADQSAVISQQVRAIHVDAEIILEPARRDSCAAVLVGAWQALQRDKNAVILVLAADHHVAEAERFRAMVMQALPAAEQGYIVTFGIEPTYPATGYGYILPSSGIDGTSCSKVSRFAEKPNRDVAERYIAEGCLWNSGNFLARADTLAKEAKFHAAAVWQSVEAACRKATAGANARTTVLDQSAYESAPRISLDFAIMEKTSRAAVQPVSYGWNDIGTWDSIATILPKDANGNALAGQANCVDGHNNLVFAEGTVAIVHGLDDLIVVATPDAVLVARRGESEKVKALLEELTRRGIKIPA